MPDSTIFDDVASEQQQGGGTIFDDVASQDNLDTQALPPEVATAIQNVPRPAAPAMEPTGSHYVAAADPVAAENAARAKQTPPLEAVGELVPQGAVPALSAANRYFVQPHQRYVDAVKKGTESAYDALSPQPDMTGAPDWIKNTAQVERGVTKGVLGTAASTLADPLNWPFLAKSAAQPILQRVISAGFTGMMGKQAIDAAQQLHDNWDKMTPEQRAQMGTEGGLSAVFAARGAREAVDPRLMLGITPDEYVVRAGVNPPGLGPRMGEVRIPRGPRPSPAPANGLEPPTIDAVPPTQSEIADAMEQTNYAGPEATKAQIEKNRVAATAAAQPVEPEKGPASIAPAETKPSVRRPATSKPVAPKPTPTTIEGTTTGGTIFDEVAKEATSAGGKPTEGQAAEVPENADARATVQWPQAGVETPSTRPETAGGKKQEVGLDQQPIRDEHGNEVDIMAGAPPRTVPEQEEHDRKVYGLDKAPTAEPPIVEGETTSEPTYKHRSTQVNIPESSEASQSIEAARTRISDADLAGDGKDVGGNHVTVRYGLRAGTDVEGVKKYLSSLEPFEARLGITSVFPPSESSDGAAVVHAPIISPELQKINAEIEKHGDFAPSNFPDYKPHATIAYVKPEAAQRYKGMGVTSNKKFPINEIGITDREGKQEIVKLEGKAAANPRYQPSQYGPPKRDWLAEGGVSPENMGHPPSAEDLGLKVRSQTERRLGALPRGSASPSESEKLGIPPKPGDVGHMRVSDLRVNANKFQYKLGTDTAGTGTLLKETKVFNPDLAGTISIWRDPADGKTYVVNGHHRFELAKRLGEKRIAVRHIVAKDAAVARAVGARQNIGEGRGTAIDAAKFFRETGATPEKLEEHGISLGEATARNGLHLSRLSDSLFNKVVQGDLPQGQAVAIGEGTADHAEQAAILKQIEKRERGGSKVSADRIREFIRLAKGSEQRTETTADLFGSQEVSRSLAWEKSEISEYIKQQLAKDKKLFGFVSKGERATELERGGNKIDVEKSKEISTGAAEAAEVYDKLSTKGGPISGILDEAARKLADGENAGTVKADAYKQVRAEVSKVLAPGTGQVPEGLEKGTGRNEVGEATTSQPSDTVEPTLPGMEQVPAERAEANADQQGKDLTAKLTEPPKSIEAKAGEIEQHSPLFRDTEANPQRNIFEELAHGEEGSFTPSSLKPSAVKRFYRDWIHKVIDENLDLGEKYQRVKERDPEIAALLHDKDHAPRYYHDKAESNIRQVAKGLSEEKVRLTAMMADNDAREYLEEHHPDQYQQALGDPDVTAAVQRFKPFQNEIAALRMSLGWHVRRDLSVFENEPNEKGKVSWSVLDRNGREVDVTPDGEMLPVRFKSHEDAQAYVEANGEILDHLKRTYPEHLREPLMGRIDEGPGLGASYGGIKPPRPDKKQRLATAEYFYQHGAKDFSGYVKSYTQVRHAALNQRIFDQLTNHAEQWKEGTAMPPQIDYRGETYYSPQVAQSMKLAKPENRPKVINEYRAYDPAKDDKALIKDFENGWSTRTTGRPGISASDRWLAPKEVVQALEQYDMTRGQQENDSIRRFFQEQIVGLFGPTVHVLNIMRRLAHTVGSGAWDPRVWPYYQKLFFSKELRERMAEGLEDDAIDALSKHGTYTNARDIGSLHAYALGNMNPGNWVRQTVGKFSKGVLFDPKFMNGFGGLDQKARVLAYDFLHDEQGWSEKESARNVEDGFGNYNKANWTERMKRWARMLLFPGWDFSSLKWFLEHPIKTAFLPSLVTMGANLALNYFGKNKDQDKYDYGYLHYGDRKFRTSLLTESMALHLATPVLEAGKAAVEGGDVRDIASAAGQGAIRGTGGFAGALRPDAQMLADLISNRQYLGGEKEIWKPEDANMPGKVLPTRQLDKMATFALVKAFPSINRFLDSSYDNVDLASGAGSVLGVTNYREGAEQRLRANAAKAKGYSQTLSELSVADPQSAVQYVQDPDKAMYLVFNKDLAEMETDLKNIDKESEEIKLAPIIARKDRDQALKSLSDARKQVLNSADAVADAMSSVRVGMKKK